MVSVMENMKFIPKTRFSIGSRVVLTDPTYGGTVDSSDNEEIIAGHRTIYTISDFVFSAERQEWGVEFFYYNDSIDSGTCFEWLDEFEKRYDFAEKQTEGNNE